MTPYLATVDQQSQNGNQHKIFANLKRCRLSVRPTTQKIQLHRVPQYPKKVCCAGVHSYIFNPCHVAQMTCTAVQCGLPFFWPGLHIDLVHKSHILSFVRIRFLRGMHITYICAFHFGLVFAALEYIFGLCPFVALITCMAIEQQ